MCPFFERTGCPCDDAQLCIRAHGRMELRSHNDPITMKLLHQYINYEESFRVSIYCKETDVEEEKRLLSQSDTSSYDQSYDIDRDDQTQDVAHLNTIIKNLRNELSSRKQSYKKISKGYQNEINELKAKNIQIYEDYLEMITDLREERDNLKSIMQQNERKYKRELEKNKKSFENQLDILSAANKN